MWLLYVAYAIVFLASLFGNSVIIHIIRTDNSMKTTTNYLILNQACADAWFKNAWLMGAVHYSSMNNSWFGGLFGLITCNIFFLFVSGFYAFSLWILATIAVDRLYAVTRPLRASPVSQHLKKTILFMWALSLATSANLLEDGNLKRSKKSYYCHISGILPGWTTFNVITSVLNRPLPLLILAVTYTKVCRKLWSREVPGEGSNQNEQQAGAVKTGRKVTIMMIVIAVLYVLCWFPFFILTMLQYFGYIQLNGSFLLFIIWLTVAYSALNPYVYFTFSRNFRNGLTNLLRNCQGKIKFCNRNIISFRTQSVDLEQI